MMDGRVRLLVVYLIVYLLALFPSLGGSTLPLDKPCGELTCEEHQYCRQFDHTCQQCNVICNGTSNNFDRSRCESDCQDYLHDIRYLRVQNESGDFLLGSELTELYRGLQKDVMVLKVLVGISLVVISITIASFIAFVIYFWKFTHPSSSSDKGNQEKKAKPVELPTIYNIKYGVNSTPSPPETRSPQPPSTLPRGLNESGNNISSSSESPVKSETSNNSINTPGTISTIVNNGSNSVMSQRFRREPSESTLPEYAYDNASLSPQHYSNHV